MYLFDSIIFQEDLVETIKVYWESSHYKKELGDLVLDDLFEYRHTSRDGDHKFGVQITSNNIDSHLEIIRQEKKTWRKNNPNGVDELNAMKELIH